MFQSAIFTLKTTNVDMRAFSPGILDQGGSGACVPSTTVADLNLISYRMHQPYDFSVAGLYWDTLFAEGRVGQDGVSPIDSFNILKNQGIGPASIWPYQLNSEGNLANEGQQPPPSYYQNLTKASFTKLAIDPDDSSVLRAQIDSALAEGRPVAVSFTAQQWFWFMSGPLAQQQINLMNTGHFDQTPVAGHEVLIVGRDASVNGGSYIYQNSWGTGYGDSGYGEMGVTWSSQFTTAVVLDSLGGHDFTYTPDKQFLAQAYVAGLDRAVDAGGLTYWAGQLVTHSKVQVLDTIVSLTDNATKTASQFVSDLYHNVLGRAADADGFAYWTGKLAAGESKGGVMLDIINAVNAYAGTDTGGVYSRNLFENKSAQSAYYGIQLEASDVTVAHQALVGITDDPNSVQVTRVGISQALGWDHIT